MLRSREGSVAEVEARRGIDRGGQGRRKEGDGGGRREGRVQATRNLGEGRHIRGGALEGIEDSEVGGRMTNRSGRRMMNRLGWRITNRSAGA